MGFGLLNFATFYKGCVEVKQIASETYNVLIKSAQDKLLAVFNLKGDLHNVWQGFWHDGKEYDINIFDNVYFGFEEVGSSKYGCALYPVNEGSTDTSKMCYLNVKEV